MVLRMQMPESMQEDDRPRTRVPGGHRVVRAARCFDESVCDLDIANRLELAVGDTEHHDAASILYCSGPRCCRDRS